MLANARACPPVPPQNLHGKEGVDGSSPSEGLNKVPANRHFVLPCCEVSILHGYETGGTYLGTGGHFRTASSRGRDCPRVVLETPDGEHVARKILLTGGRCCPCWRDGDALLTWRGGRASVIPRSY